MFKAGFAAGADAVLDHTRDELPDRRYDVVLDIGGTLSGYGSDITRTFVIGPPSAEQREVHDVVRLSNERERRSRAAPGSR